ncbi:hypothetical protein HMPREF0208_01209 [Citrobacter koseri]|nr:hypothetical protein HMPREF3220_03839 [Citrobacter koseri]KXA02912.1 hypothetical protein HMPREF3207_02083 [Citrobacter koseri]KXB45615.1 hypothetical protein HMPREF0208_01209 [Citrobacter koseri]
MTGCVVLKPLQQQRKMDKKTAAFGLPFCVQYAIRCCDHWRR